MNFDDEDFDDERGEGHERFRWSDPTTSFLAANNVESIALLEGQTIEAMQHADSYPEGCMTAFDVARHFNLAATRDSYSPSISRLADEGLLIFVCSRTCINGANKPRLMNGYRLRRAGDPDVLLPPRKSKLDRCLSMWSRLVPDDRLDFARRCAGPVTADEVWFLMGRLDARERAVLQDWIENGP